MQNHEAQKHGALASTSPPEGAATDWTVPQRWDEFTQDDHGIWDMLFARQKKMLEGRAIDAFQDGLEILHLSRPGVPDFAELNEKLHAQTGWEVVAVPGLVPDAVFYGHLSKRRFPAGNFLRLANQLDYLEEPDVFHDVFGHVPLLALPEFADFIQALGYLGLEACEKGELHRLARLYWHTVEFGLAREGGQLKIYGAGIVSSFGESLYAIESAEPQRLHFELNRVLRTRYRTDAFQQCYFVIDQFEDVLKLLSERDFISTCIALDSSPDLEPSARHDQSLGVDCFGGPDASVENRAYNPIRESSGI